MHEVLKWKRTTVLGNRCIKFRTRSRTPSGHEWFEVPMRQSTLQHYTVTYSNCKQKIHLCRNKIQQHRTISIRHTLRPRKISHYCVAYEVGVITDHKSLVAIFKKDVATLSQRLQQEDAPANTPVEDKSAIQPGLQLYIADQLSRHKYTEGKDEELRVINMNINVIETCTNMPECMMTEEIRYGM